MNGKTVSRSGSSGSTSPKFVMRSRTCTARILHRDLKPANVFLTLDGTAKVGLGLGRMMSEHTFDALQSGHAIVHAKCCEVDGYG